ncbi:MAG: YggT family protein [Acidimicrobiales bacterium]|nr:YggT family protein [Acidimicrobiales bacterium]
MGIVCTLIILYMVVLVARAVLTWFPIDPDGGMAAVAGFLFMVTDPVLAPLRRTLPPLRIGSVALDLSFIVVIIGLQILLSIIC